MRDHTRQRPTPRRWHAQHLWAVALWVTSLLGFHSYSWCQIDCGFAPDDFVLPGVDGEVRCLASVTTPNGECLAIGGLFAEVGGVEASSLALFNGSEIVTAGDVVGAVNVIRSVPSGFVIGGAFSNVGGVPANFVAIRDGSNWQSLGSGVNGPVYALEYFDAGSGEMLHVGGDFTVAGGLPCSGWAIWNGADWEVPAGDFDGPIGALKAFEGELWVGGEFSTIGLLTVNHVARWDGSVWSDAAGGANDRVFAFHEFDFGDGARLLMGGAFTMAGGVVTGRTTRWSEVHCLSGFFPNTPPVSLTGNNGGRCLPLPSL